VPAEAAGWTVVARHALRESARRRVLHVVGGLSIAFLALFGFGAREAFDDDGGSGFGPPGFDDPLVAATLLGLAMFAILFLGAVLAVFLTHDAVRGDAERGLLQPMVVRPPGRVAYLAGRTAAAMAISCPYVAVMFLAAFGLGELTGDAPTGGPIAPALHLSGAVALLAAASLLGSVALSGTANGIAVFMVFGAGLTGGLVGEIGDALDIDSLESTGRALSWALPFEALYLDGLRQLTEGVPGLAGQLVQLGPFGGARDFGPLLWPWALVYLAGLLGIAARALARKDL
jgi:Cu-processing system permease protein